MACTCEATLKKTKGKSTWYAHCRACGNAAKKWYVHFGDLAI